MYKVEKIEVFGEKNGNPRVSWDGKQATIEEPLTAVVYGTKDGKKLDLKFKFNPGWWCDGLSVPRIFQWFIKAWDNSNLPFSFAGACHDMLYANKGYGVLNREECDDVFRGCLRESGVSRFKAGMADKAVELFAGGKKHWGHFEDKDKLVIAEFLK